MKAYQRGSAHLIILIVVLVVVVGALGVVAYNQFQKSNAPATGANNQSTKTSHPEPACKEDETESAKNGTFCSENIGIKFTVPAQFKDKLAKAANYEVFEGPIDQPSGTSAGTSETVFEGKLEAPEYGQTVTLILPLLKNPSELVILA